MAALHRRAAGWFIRQGRVVDAIRHTQAAGDWPQAARLLADHSFSLTLDGQSQTMLALARAFPPGEDHPELALVRAGGDLVHGRLDEAAAHLSVAETYAATAPPDRQRRLQVAIASLRLSLARRRGHLVGVIEQVRFLASPVTGRSDEDIALGSDLRAVALMNLGTVEAWTLALPDAERHLRQGAALAREIGRPYLEVSCLSELAFASKIDPFATTQLRCREAIALAERYGWDAEPVISPALMTMAGTSVVAGRVRRGRAMAAAQRPGPGNRHRADHQAAAAPHDRGSCTPAAVTCNEALEEFNAAEHLRSQLEGSHALAGQVTGWRLATLARLGRPGEARAAFATVDDDRAYSGELVNACAAICLAEGDPAGALAAVRPVLDGTAPVIGYVTVLEAHLLAGLAYRGLGDQRAASRAVERALALAEADRLVLPFAMTSSLELLESLPQHETAHARAAREHPRRPARLTPGARSSAAAAGRRRAQPGRAAGTALPADELVPARDRRRAVGLGEYRQHPRPQHLRQAPGQRPLLGRAARPRAAAAGGRPHALAARSPDPGDARSPAGR